jgi:integrase
MLETKGFPPLDWLLLDLQARGAMRIGEVLKVTHGDIENTRITLWNAKSGSEQKVVFIPKRVTGRLRTYVREQGVRSNSGISHQRRAIWVRWSQAEAKRWIDWIYV